MHARIPLTPEHAARLQEALKAVYDELGGDHMTFEAALNPGNAIERVAQKHDMHPLELWRIVHADMLATALSPDEQHTEH